MEVDVFQRNVEGSEGIVATSLDFGVKNPALIFDILCNRMYQNPLRTMLQEYMSNARDAHREIGRGDRPIEITLPNRFDEHLRIRDFGPGLSPTRIEEVFVFLGESTKRGDNIQTGGFGIGAKVGWAYSDSFTIISYFEGVQRTYLAFLGDDGVGKLTRVSEVETTEENGVEIQLRIKRTDLSNAVQAIQYIAYFWEVPPVIHGENTLVWFSGKRKSAYFNVDIALPDVCAVVDGIVYPITEEGAPQSAQLHIPYGQSAVFFFETGELDLAVNREGLRYSEKTIAAVDNEINLVIEQAEAAWMSAVAASSLSDMFSILNTQLTDSTVLLRKKRTKDLFEGADSKYAGIAKLVNELFQVNLVFNFDNELFTCFRSVLNSSLRAKVGSKRISSAQRQMTVGSGDIGDLSVFFTKVEDLDDAVPSKGRLHVLMEQKGTNTNTTFVTNDPVLYQLFIGIGVTDLNAVAEPVVPRGRMFSNDEVKSIDNRNHTKNINDLDASAHCWCRFTERAEVNDNHSVKQAVNNGAYRCFYLTADQVDYVVSMGIPHYTAIVRRVEMRERLMATASLFGDLQAKSFNHISSSHEKWSRIGEFAGIIDSDLADLDRLTQQYKRYYNAAHFLRNADIGKDRFKKFVRNERNRCERAINVLLSALSKRYPLIGHLDYYSRASAAEDIVIYMNAKFSQKV